MPKVVGGTSNLAGGHTNSRRKCWTTYELVGYYNMKHDVIKIDVVLNDYFEKSNEPLAVAYRDQLFKDIYPNTELGIDLKLLTRKPGRMKEGESLNGCLTRDGEYHYLFIQNAEQKKSVSRNPHVYRGKYININRKDDGTLYPTFKRPVLTPDFTIRDFCLAAASELVFIAGLVEETDSK